MIRCPRCGQNNSDSSLRCKKCDEWFLFYEFNNLKDESVSEQEVAAKKQNLYLFKKEAQDDSVETEPKKNEPLFFSPEPLDIEDWNDVKLKAVFQDIFDPVCPNCGGDVKQYEVRCRHCQVMLYDKIEKSRRLRPYWDQIFQNKILSDGKYEDLTSGEDVKLLFKKIFNKGNRLVLYMVYILLFMIFSGVFLMFCMRSVANRF